MPVKVSPSGIRTLDSAALLKSSMSKGTKDLIGDGFHLFWVRVLSLLLRFINMGWGFISI